MTHILHVFGRMVRGGAELRTLELLRHLDRNRFRFSFCCLSGLPGELDGEVRSLGGEVFPQRLDLSFPGKFRVLCRKGDIQVVHSHVHLSSGLILVLAKAAGVPVRIAHFRSMSDGRGDSPARRARRAVLKRLLDRYATDILAVSEGAMAASWGAGWANDHRCRVVYNGIEIDGYVDVVAPGSVREEFAIPPADDLYIHVGRMTKAKNHPRLLAIFRCIRALRPNSTLLLVGRREPAIERALVAQIVAGGLAEKVRIIGERDDIPRLLREADLTLFPSLWEGLPGVVLESCAAGTPVLASDLPGVREIAARLLPASLVASLSLDENDGDWAAAAVAMCRRGRATVDPATVFADTPFDMQVCLQNFYQIWSGAQ